MDRTKLQASIILHEGFRGHPYADTKGNITIGYGHNLTASGISPKVASVLLDEDIDQAIVLLAKWLPWTTALDDVRYRVFVELIYNLGGNLLAFTHALAAAQIGHWPASVDAFHSSLWDHEVGHRAAVLEAMLLTGQDPS